MYIHKCILYSSHQRAKGNCHTQPVIPPGRQKGEVAARQQGVTLRAHPTGIEELLGIFLLNGLEVEKMIPQRAEEKI